MLDNDDPRLILFILICKFGVEHKMGKIELAGTLAATSDFLRTDDRPLEFFIANPKGTRNVNYPTTN